MLRNQLAVHPATMSINGLSQSIHAPSLFMLSPSVCILLLRTRRVMWRGRRALKPPYPSMVYLSPSLVWRSDWL